MSYSQYSDREPNKAAREPNKPARTFKEIELYLWGDLGTFEEHRLKELLDTEACGRAAIRAQYCVPTFEEYKRAIRKS